MTNYQDQGKKYHGVDGEITQDKFNEAITVWRPRHIIPVNSGWYLCKRTELDIFVAYYIADKKLWEANQVFESWTDIPK